MPVLALVLNVHGGVVQGVFASSPDVEVTLVDWDVDPADAEHPEVVEIAVGIGRTRLAHVAPLVVRALAELAGTDVEAAIEAADVVAN